MEERDIRVVELARYLIAIPKNSFSSKRTDDNHYLGRLPTLYIGSARRLF